MISRNIHRNARRCRSVCTALALLAALGVCFTGVSSFAEDATSQASAEEEAKKSKWEPGEWRPLFDGKTLKGWKKTEFGGEGEVKVNGGEIHLEFGASMTGITYAGKDLPKTNYEVELDATRTGGFDFFSGLTFPVKDSHCSFIVGGWGGGVVGLSSIDDFDASENDTTTFMQFKNKKWYTIRVRVLDDKIQAWIDGKKVVDQDIKDRKVSTRIEMDLCKPLGLATWETSAALKNIRLRKLPKETGDEKEQPEQADDSTG